MKRTYILLVAVGICGGWLPAQIQPGSPDYVLHYAQSMQTLGQAGGGRGISAPLPRAEKGKPFSATATTQTVQTYLDGTRVSQSMTIVEYRDAEGRLRTEASGPAGGPAQPRNITIRDPVAGVAYRLDVATKTAQRMSMPGTAAAGGGRGGRMSGAPASDVVLPRQGPGQPAAEPRSGPNGIVEDLGTATINGVSARGTRITTVVPAGAIGNDREFRSTSEHWFSPDLNLVVKSVSTDPRFGTTTYELTNISRQPPELSLFQVPADYTIISQ